jgi:hypothetical protein
MFSNKAYGSVTFFQQRMAAIRNQSPNVVVKIFYTRSSYSGGPGFKFRPEDRLS